MSYDVSIEKRCTCGSGSIDVGNYTSNCSKMLVSGCGKSLSEFNGMKASDALLDLRKGYEWMQSHLDECKKMNPSNGWGDYKSWIVFIGEIIQACEELPDGIVGVY